MRERLSGAYRQRLAGCTLGIRSRSPAARETAARWSCAAALATTFEAHPGAEVEAPMNTNTDLVERLVETLATVIRAREADHRYGDAGLPPRNGPGKSPTQRESVSIRARNITRMDTADMSRERFMAVALFHRWPRMSISHAISRCSTTKR